jgi:glycosyltransferase involved in cell wall biosynthesis
LILRGMSEPRRSKIGHMTEFHSWPRLSPALLSNGCATVAAPAALNNDTMEDRLDSRPPASATDSATHVRNRRSSLLRIALVTNHPPPFRTPIYERIAAVPDVDLHAIFCSRREPNRSWEIPPLAFNHRFLKERFVARGSNYIHNNPDVFAQLRRVAPDVIVTTGFNPTHLYAFAYALFKGIPHVPMTDGTDVSEQALSGVHRAIRRFVYARSPAFIAASRGGLRLYHSYGVAPEHCFQSCLCIDNHAYDETPAQQPRFDLLFCGRMVAAKNPLFALHVAASLAMRLKRTVRILFVGSGAAENAVRARAAQQPGLIEAEFHGHAAQHELPHLYRAARLFLFPTQADVWGVVANEACAAGVPIIVSSHAGVAGELVVDGENGFVRPLDVEQWADCAARLLTDDSLHRRFSARSRALVRRYTFDHAANGIVDACRHAAGDRAARRLAEPSRKAGT